MNTNQIVIRYKLTLKRWDLDDLFHDWVLFHRWLPDGPDDAITHMSSDGNTKTAFWFERHGYVGGEGIQFELDRHDVSDEVMDRQAVLESGPLHARVTIDDVKTEVIEAVRERKRGDPDYVTFAKRLIKEHLYPALSNFTRTIRYHFGQYWIRDFESWDSRQESLGRYCKNLSMEASVDDGRTWLEFIPNEPTSGGMQFTLEFVHPKLFITRDDWKELQMTFANIPEPSVAVQVLNYAHELLDQGHLRHALVEIVTALEIAVNDFMRRATGGKGIAADAAQSFYDTPLPAKVATICLARDVDRQDLDLTLDAIKARNCLVHEAKQPPDECKTSIRAALRVCASFLEGPFFKFPPNNTGNTLVEDTTQWSKQYERRVV